VEKVCFYVQLKFNFHQLKKPIVQDFIKDKDEYSTHLICINGEITKHVIMCQKYQKYQKYHIRKTHFDNYKCIENLI
jgi:hypothetical protein